jgi:hypothetical protein
VVGFSLLRELFRRQDLDVCITREVVGVEGQNLVDAMNHHGCDNSHIVCGLSETLVLHHQFEPVVKDFGCVGKKSEDSQEIIESGFRLHDAHAQTIVGDWAG